MAQSCRSSVHKASITRLDAVRFAFLYISMHFLDVSPGSLLDTRTLRQRLQQDHHWEPSHSYCCLCSSIRHRPLCACLRGVNEDGCCGFLNKDLSGLAARSKIQIVLMIVYKLHEVPTHHPCNRWSSKAMQLEVEALPGFEAADGCRWQS